MTTLRSEDWSVRPSFVPHGPTSPVTLLADDEHLTQLAGIPAVAWQTPWREIDNLQLVRFAHQMALFATVGGVRYCWRHRSVADYDAIAALVLAHGGAVARRRRRSGVLVVVAIVVLAASAGGAVARLNGDGNTELHDAQSANITLKDLPTGSYVAVDSPLAALVPASNKVYTPVTTTVPKPNSVLGKIATSFQSCLGVTNARDRLYGAAGQQAAYTVASPIFSTDADGGVLVASIAQYYATTTMVDKDTREMGMKNFGLCFATSSATTLLLESGSRDAAAPGATNWQPATFTKGFSAGGAVPVSVAQVSAKLRLVSIIVTHGHYEVTLDALVSSLSKATPLLNGLTNTLLSRATSSTSEAA